MVRNLRIGRFHYLVKVSVAWLWPSSISLLTGKLICFARIHSPELSGRCTRPRRFKPQSHVLASGLLVVFVLPAGLEPVLARLVFKRDLFFVCKRSKRFPQSVSRPLQSKDHCWGWVESAGSRNRSRHFSELLAILEGGTYDNQNYHVI